MDIENDVVGIAKREHNQKRLYLVVNKLQGKHVPAKPSIVLHMFDRLAEVLTKRYHNENMLLIGFAETATAIGAEVAIRVNALYMQTTREAVEGVQYLYFTENHSHATEQRLVKEDIDQVIDKITRIIFIEDEVTTGNTIRNVIRVMEDTYGNQRLQFSVASILNGMKQDDIQQFRDSHIALHYLVKTDHSKYEAMAAASLNNGTYYRYSGTYKKAEYKEYQFPGYVNARRVTHSEDYLNACKNLWNDIQREIHAGTSDKILVLGTEEFMFPALFVAHRLEQNGCNVRFHATTRSPIMVSREPDYPLHARYELSSLYDPRRITYLYDLEPYDRCMILTDAPKAGDIGMENGLIQAVWESNTPNIDLIRWH